jgi:hypothetical protein
VLHLHNRSKKSFVTTDMLRFKEFISMIPLASIKFEEALKAKQAAFRARAVKKEEHKAGDSCWACRKTFPPPRSYVFRHLTREPHASCIVCGKVFCDKCCVERPHLKMSICRGIVVQHQQQ